MSLDQGQDHGNDHFLDRQFVNGLVPSQPDENDHALDRQFVNGHALDRHTGNDLDPNHQLEEGRGLLIEDFRLLDLPTDDGCQDLLKGDFLGAQEGSRHRNEVHRKNWLL